MYPTVSLKRSGKIRKIESWIQLRIPRKRNRTVCCTGTFFAICIHRSLTLPVVSAVGTKPTVRFLPSGWKKAFSRAQHLQRSHWSKASGGLPEEHREEATRHILQTQMKEKSKSLGKAHQIKGYMPKTYTLTILTPAHMI